MPDDRARLGPILRSARTIAVVGLSPRPDRPSHEVAAYLQAAGYRIVPVNPGAGTVLGEPAFPDLVSAQGAAGPLEVVNIFRRSEAVAALVGPLRQIRPRLVWMQVGVQDPGAARELEAAGITVVMNRCLMVDHPWLVGE